MSDERPSAALFDRVLGQEAAVAVLRSSAAAPVHAYLFVGPDSSGARAAAHGFAAALLCPTGGCGVCSTCRRTLAGTHPDFMVVDRVGAAISVVEAREVVRLALRTPTEAERKVLVLTDFHTVEEAAPALLKTIEEPPPSAVFCILADQVTPDLVTIASRCVRVEFPPLSEEAIEAALLTEGVAPDVAALVGAAAAGSLDRARILAADPAALDRLTQWRAVPDRLDGTASAVIVAAGDLVALLDAAAAPVIERQKADDAELAARAKAGLPVPNKRDLEALRRREQRRARTDELRGGLAALAAAYRQRMMTEDRRAARRALAALDALADAGERIIYNPSEPTLLEGLLARLSR